MLMELIDKIMSQISDYVTEPCRINWLGGCWRWKMRLIDADKLYEYIDDEIYTTDKYAEVEDILDIIAKFAEETPNKWIPCSERLPEEDGTLRGYLVNVGDWVGMAHFIDGEFWESYLEKMRFDYPVKAWMPLPSSYQGE